jgi:two-component system, OmpR family, sensor histidine kinase CiaH
MFESARLKLTAWYLIIIMLISIFFSMAFYQVATREIQAIIDRIEHTQRQLEEYPEPFRPRFVTPFSLEDLQAVKDRIKLNLILVNGFIFIAAGGLGYFLAGRTLKPIKLMVEEQNQFISNASHELRTPIATMRAEMEGNLLERKISDKRARDLISSNLEELTTLQNLTNNLLQLAHVHNSTSQKYTEVLSLDEIIKAALKKVDRLAKQKEISLTSDLGKYKVIGDKHGLTEVFVILLDNAIKYSPENSQVTVSTKRSKTGVAISVTDNGSGIDKEDLPHIFERFYRANKARSKDGYGLGLSIAKKIIEIHNGSIDVKSTLKKGTTFIVSLPSKTSARL